MNKWRLLIITLTGIWVIRYRTNYLKLYGESMARKLACDLWAQDYLAGKTDVIPHNDHELRPWWPNK